MPKRFIAIRPVTTALDTRRACASRESSRGLRRLRPNGIAGRNRPAARRDSSCDSGVPPSRRSSALACAAAFGPAISSSSIRRASAALSPRRRKAHGPGRCAAPRRPEPLAGQEIAAQLAGVDRAQKDRNQRSRREAEPHLRHREECVVGRDHDVAAAHQRDTAADAGAVNERDGRFRDPIERVADGRDGRARFPGSAGCVGAAPISAPTQKCLPAPRSTIARTCGVGGEPRQLRDQCVEHDLVVAIALLGPVEQQGRDPAPVDLAAQCRGIGCGSVHDGPPACARSPRGAPSVRSEKRPV